MIEPDLEFDQNGFLTPYRPIRADLATLERVFVTGFPTSATRRGHFERFREYNDRLRAYIPTGATQWVDGSFVSRKLNPDDIDVLTFLDADLYAQYEQTFRALRDEFSRGTGRVDAFVIQVYPVGHRYRHRYESDHKEWLFVWSQTNTRPHLNKGFIDLKTN